jgi:hypothetical protein
MIYLENRICSESLGEISKIVAFRLDIVPLIIRDIT